ncbi:MAG: 50S ribosomal protein L22 [Dehalococcoidia bacterium]|nr:50S ribosomal protein L22 [Dehalococcoidia bacterium]
MPPIKAYVKNFGMSPKKVRRYVDLIRGKRVKEAVAMLQFMPSPAATAVRKAVQSAVANAENNQNMDATDLKVVTAFADDALKISRFRPQSRGRTSPVIRRFCHITVVVGEANTNGA